MDTNTNEPSAVVTSPEEVRLSLPTMSPLDRQTREVRYLFNEVFRESAQGMSYYVGQRLVELFPDKTIVECRGFGFDPVRYASAGLCSWKMKTTPQPQWTLDWEESVQPLGQVRNLLQQGWMEIEWETERFECIMMHVTEGQSRQRHCWIIAGRSELAKRFIETVSAWNVKPREELLVYDGDEWDKDKDLFRTIKSASFDNLILAPGRKDEMLADITGFFEEKETYRRYGIPWKRGVLFVGPPGNGKTHTVKALINHLKQPCLYVKSFHGNVPGSYAIAEVFFKARRHAPCVLVLEDLDSLVQRGNRSYFLNEMDGFADNDGILTLATSNHPERLDPALADRPSRFDRTYQFHLPGRDERLAYLAYWNASLEPDLHVEESVLRELVEFTDGFSFAHLKELGLSALMAWIRMPERDMALALRSQLDLLRRQRSKTGKAD